MEHKLLGLGFFLLFLGLVLFILLRSSMPWNRNPASYIVWSLIGFFSSISLFTGALLSTKVKIRNRDEKPPQQT
jgi:hypothetical protein